MFATAIALAAAHQAISYLVALAFGSSIAVALHTPRVRKLHESIRKH